MYNSLDKDLFKLSDIIDIDFMQRIQDDFADTLGFAAITIDNEKPFTKPSNFTDFCVCKTRKSKEGMKNCLHCDLKGGEKALKEKKPVIYSCHAGLTDFAVPITIEGKHIGSILCGQVRTDKLDEKKIRQLAKKYDINEEEYIEAYRKIKYVPKEQLEIVAKSLWLIANTVSEMAYNNYKLIVEQKVRASIEKILRIINESNEKEEILQPMCKEIADLFNIERVIIMKFSEQGPELQCDYTINPSIYTIKEHLSTEEYQKVLDFWNKKLLERNEITIFDDIEQVGVPPQIKKYYLNHKIKTTMSKTFCRTDDSVMVIVLAKYYENRPWTKMSEDTLRVITAQIEVALNKAKLHQENYIQQEREKALLNNLPYTAWLKDKDGKYLTVNKVALQMYGHKIEEILGKDDFEIFGTNAGKIRQEEDRKVIESKQSIFFEKESMVKGIKRYVEGYKSPVFDKNGEVIATAGIVKDVTDIKEVDQIKSEFVSIVSHELRTPVTSIRGGLELVINGLVGEIPEKAKELLRIANSNSQRLCGIIDNILDLEKLETDNIKLDNDFNNVKQMIESVINDNKAYAEQAQIPIFTDIDLDDINIKVDRKRFMQVLSNLLTNAIKFSLPDNKVSLIAKCINNNIHIGVTNKGPIIPEGSASIFEKFSQIDASDTRKKGGIGLGLTISKLLIEKMGGKIGYTSSDGQTTFFVHLPKAN
ncbi:MAG: PocR ligand-binding domain-containing protein [Candidatus Gastranaerophilales bacterium]|nr:PocR ligand-binding domain-containing protein [Candidatus Gastranaerophilales bacterium]